MSDELSCGECTACCTVLEVESVKDCGAGVPCPHLAEGGKGCGIYEERPQACRNYRCLWLAGALKGDELRPDRYGIIFDEGETTEGEAIIRAHVAEEEGADPLKKRIFIQRVVAASGRPVAVLYRGATRFIIRLASS